MNSGSNYIYRKQLSRWCSPLAQRFEIEIVNETSSTNTDLIKRWRRARLNPRPVVRVAYSQTAGRGRHQRVWLAPAGSALLFSLAYLMPRALSDVTGLSLATGVAIIEGLSTLPLAEPQRLRLKWPNDILLDDAKLAGILIETAWHTPNASMMVIGIGINLNREPLLATQLIQLTALPTNTNLHRWRPAALSQMMPEVVNHTTYIFASLLNALASMLKRFSDAGFAPFCDAWNAYHAYPHHPVILSAYGKAPPLYGVALGVDCQGSLLMETAGGVVRITSGDLSLNLALPDVSASSAPRRWQ